MEQRIDGGLGPWSVTRREDRWRGVESERDAENQDGGVRAVSEAGGAGDRARIGNHKAFETRAIRGSVHVARPCSGTESRRREGTSITPPMKK